MSTHRACAVGLIEELLRTPSMKSHAASDEKRILKILASWE
jgi:hypothetical protein